MVTETEKSLLDKLNLLEGCLESLGYSKSTIHTIEHCFNIIEDCREIIKEHKR